MDMVTVAVAQASWLLRSQALRIAESMDEPDKGHTYYRQNSLSNERVLQPSRLTFGRPSRPRLNELRFAWRSVTSQSTMSARFEDMR